MTPGVKLTMGALLVAGAIGYLAYSGAANSWQYYLSVDEAVGESANLIGKQIRVSGRVSPGSLTIDNDRREATFEMRGERDVLMATCRCMLPDNLAENIDVVVEGTLQANRIDGHKVITRCASKYQPKQTSTTRLESPGKRT
jgi:cytochrome c-type biogenesis protein CcmE